MPDMLTLGDFKDLVKDNSSMLNKSLLLILPKSMLAPHIHSTIDDVRPVIQNSDETTFVSSADGIEEEEDEDDDIFDTLSLSNLLERTIDSDDSDNEDDDESFHR